MTNHQHIGVHGVERHRRVDEGFTLFDGTGGRRHIDDVGAESFASEFEGRARARRYFEEEINDGATAQGGGFLVRTAILLDISIGFIKQVGDLVTAQTLNTEEMAVRIT